jgi:hypothetical protein
LTALYELLRRVRVHVPIDELGQIVAVYLGEHRVQIDARVGGELAALVQPLKGVDWRRRFRSTAPLQFTCEQE